MFTTKCGVYLSLRYRTTLLTSNMPASMDDVFADGSTKSDITKKNNTSSYQTTIEIYRFVTLPNGTKVQSNGYKYIDKSFPLK